MKVGVIIPAYNEAERILDTIRAVCSLPEVEEVLVVDDGSTDDTAARALRAGVRVAWHRQNFGKGQALKTGLQSIRSEIVAMIDADIGERAVELRKLAEPVRRGKADLAIAQLPPAEGKNGFGIVKGLAKWGIRRLTGFTAQAPLSGQRVFRRDIVRHLNLADGYGAEVAMTIDALRAGYRVLEVPVAMKNREYGRSLRGFLHRGRQFWHVAQALLERWRETSDPKPVDDSASSWR